LAQIRIDRYLRQVTQPYELANGNPIEVSIVIPCLNEAESLAELVARLEATLGLYRFTGAGASLLDWAILQSGLRDPLSRFSRHELEQFFDRFKFNLDSHLKRLVYEMKREDPAGLAELCASAAPSAKQALRRADAGR